MTPAGTTNVAGMVAQRWALISHLGQLDADEWSRPLDDGLTLRDAVGDLIGLYGRVLGESDLELEEDLVNELDRRADMVERKLSDIGDDRWNLSVEEFEAVGGTAQMALHRLMTEMVLLAVRCGAPVPPPAREAAAAAVAWRVGDNVEVPALVVLEDYDENKELVLGAGEPEVTVRTDSLSFVCAAMGLDGDGQLRIDGPDEAADAFRRSFTGAWRAYDRDTDERS